MADGNSWSLEFDGEGVAWLTCDMPGASANVLSAAVIGELAGRLSEIHARAPTGLVVRSAKASGFIAGADIHEFQKIKRTLDRGESQQ